MSTKKPKKATRPMFPRVPFAIRLGAIMHRRDAWPAKWINAFIELAPRITEAGLSKIERRYKAEWPPNRNRNSLRHDLYTLINWYDVEVDRANAWNDAHPEKKERKIIPMPAVKIEPYVPTTAEDIAALDRFEALRAERKRSAFQNARKAMGK